ncbi:hypothetical protein ACDI89_25540 (plasmid) [Mycobacteroides abscessus]|uniref:hypothetical protein n=1 Tax=Mycobacteroides abscessus TaxID=36809 RepID=UPI0009A91478|nr:hypothetical protein [Mycobacteroides abscessus]MBE5408319.1 hypothetical protein [Mycobacteroides abscessus]MBN7468771.1 hypothetical protein [Mycobacteroides abscessus subsp. massiliense]MDM2402514.1 hypothetical protein [Mycobacteroides abscessus]MDM2412814.1 hypothetical protein [Mycobacteroides abscessus]OTR18140.1 hypothetical protein B9M82_02990 [Mycobacteroides abscessus]
MGNYTELFVRVELRKDAPAAVLAALAAYAKGAPVIPDGLADHEFFGSPDWDRVLSMGDYVTPTAQQPVQFWLDEGDNPDQWRLIVHCSAKNYHGSFEKFLDWIIPYVDAGPGEFLGYVLNEDNADELRLIFYPPADHRYLTVVETSPGGEGAAINGPGNDPACDGKYELYVSVSKPFGGVGWNVKHSGTYEQVTGALDELARRIRADLRAGGNDLAATKCTVGGESYWPDGEPLDIWGGERLAKEIPTELFAHAALIRQTAATGHKDRRDWNWTHPG